MKLYLNRGYITSSYVPQGIKGTYYMKIFSPVVDDLAPATSTTVTGTFDATGKITHIIVGFNVNAQGVPKYIQNDFSCGFKARGVVADVPAGILAIANGITEDKNTTDGVSLIQVRLRQSLYPQETYTLNVTPAGTGVRSSTNDLFHCYQDYCVMTDALRTPVRALMSCSQWMCNPLFVFKTHQSKNDTSNVYSIKVDLSAPLTTPTDIYIVGLYDTYLTLEYDDMSRLKSMLPSPAMSLIE